MTFLSQQFLNFCLVFFALSLATARYVRGSRLLIFLAGVVLYGSYSLSLLALLGIVAVADYALGAAIARTERVATRRLLLVLSLSISLGLLLATKYLFFLGSLLTTGATTAFVAAPADAMAGLLPIGISFYTFESISYVVDIYRRRIKPAPDALTYGAFLSYFPHLLAGPIVRPAEFFRQWARRRRLTPPRVAEGLRLVLLGYFKKVVIADTFAAIADPLFQLGAPTGTSACLATLSFSVQIYADFSGYTDIARGLACLIGIRLPLNFQTPYASRGIREFWRRWHISLSSWLRDYLYIPLGGSRHGVLRTTVALMTTMGLGGLWHGANWTFVVWGLLHGLLLTVSHLARAAQVPSLPGLGLTRQCAVFVVVALGWTVFRAASLDAAWAQLSPMARGALEHAPLLLVGCAGLVLVDLLLRRDVARRAVFSAALVAAVLGMMVANGQRPGFLHVVAVAALGLDTLAPFLSLPRLRGSTRVLAHAAAMAAMLSLILTNVFNVHFGFIYFQF